MTGTPVPKIRRTTGTEDDEPSSGEDDISPEDYQQLLNDYERELENRADADFFMACVGLPWDPAPGQDTGELGDEPAPKKLAVPGVAVPADALPPTVQPRRPMPKNMYLTRAVLDKYGRTDGCQGCLAHTIDKGAWREHSAECRTRLQGEMSKDAEGRALLEEQEEKKPPN